MNNLIKKASIAAMAGLLPLSAAAEVSISGWVNQAMTYADDGTGSDIVSLPDNGTTLGSRLTFAGSEEVASGITAGFEIILEPRNTQNLLGFGTGTQGNLESFNAQGDAVGILGHSAYVSGGWGKMTLGLQSMPTDNIAVLEDPSLTLWSSISPIFRGTAVRLQNNNAAIANNMSFGSFSSCYASGLRDGVGIGIDCNGIYRQGIRYDLPAFGPVTVAVGYANDDIYDISAKYKGDVAGLKASLAMGYAIISQGLANVHTGAENFQVQAGLMDPGTGIFGTVAYQNEDADLIAGTGLQDTTDAVWTKVGIKKAWNSLGDTSIAFQYGLYMDQYSANAVAAAGGVGRLTGSDLERIGLEVNQYIGSNLIIYGVWENLSVDADGAGAAAINAADDLNTFTAGLTFFF